MLAPSNVRYVLPLSANVGLLVKSEYVPVNATVLNSVLLFANALATSAKLSKFTLAPPIILDSKASTYDCMFVLAVVNDDVVAKLDNAPVKSTVDALPEILIRLPFIAIDCASLSALL